MSFALNGLLEIQTPGCIHFCSLLPQFPIRPKCDSIVIKFFGFS
jgi:hypothetical protein